MVLKLQPYLYPPAFPDLTIWDWNMASESATSSASMPATSILCQVPVNVPLLTYNWNAADQMWEFCLFKCQLETLFRLCKIKAEECLDYLLCILGKEGYATMDQWVLADEVYKNYPEKFLDYIESTLDDEISPQVHVYELEDVKKRSDKSSNELIDSICQLIWAIPDADIKLQEELLKVNCNKKVSDLLEICCTYYAIESEAAAMCAGKAIHALCQGHQPQKSKPQKCTKQCPNCTCSHSHGSDNCLTWNTTCNGCSKRGHWHAKCNSSGAVGKHVAKSDGAVKVPCHWCREKGKKANIVQVSTKETPPCDELFANTVNWGTAGDTHPKEIVIDICAPQCNEAYTTVKLRASISSKGTASLCVKVNTGTGGNVLPLCVFQCLHLDWISPAGLPTGLVHISTRLTTYNGSHIPLYGTLHGSIAWQPGGPGIWPHKINSYWYVADTPSPAILGLPSCKRLAIMKMNCVVTVMQPGIKPPSLAPASTTATFSSLLQLPQQPRPSGPLRTWWRSSQIDSWALADSLVNTRSHSDMMCILWYMTPGMPHCLVPEGQGTPWQDGTPGSDHPCRWAHRLGILHYLHSEGKWWAMPVLGSPWPPLGHPLRPSQDAHCGGSCSWVCALLFLDQVGCLPWILVNHPWPGIQPAYDFQVPSEDTISCNFPLALSVPKTSSRRRWTRSLNSAKDVSELQTTSPSTTAPRQNMMPSCGTSGRLPANKIWCLIQKNTCEGSSCQFLWLSLWCQWCPPRPWKGWCSTHLASASKHHQTPKVLRPSHVPQSLHPWFVHLDCPSAWAA